MLIKERIIECLINDVTTNIGFFFIINWITVKNTEKTFNTEWNRIKWTISDSLYM